MPVYKEKYGEKLIVFSKEDYAKITDSMALSSEPKNTVVWARNAVFYLAKQKGCKHFLVLDDDYVSFRYRYVERGQLRGVECKELDSVFQVYVDFLDASNALTVCFSQGGDLVGGAEAFISGQKWKRKAMNSFFCDSDRPFTFLGRSNEDTNAYVYLGRMGKLLCQCGAICLTQTQTQAQGGGMTTEYLNNGTFVKSFYSVMAVPSGVKVGVLDEGAGARYHHRVNWNAVAPKILREKWSKVNG